MKKNKEKFEITDLMISELGFYFSHADRYSGELVYRNRWDKSEMWIYGNHVGGSRADHHKSPRQRTIESREDWDNFVLDLTGPVEEGTFDTSKYVETDYGWIPKKEWDKIFNILEEYHGK